MEIRAYSLPQRKNKRAEFIFVVTDKISELIVISSDALHQLIQVYN
jgi:hypothetical protein